MRRSWTPAEDRFIRKHYRVKPTSWIALKLDRTKGSIYQRANVLNTVRRDNARLREQNKKKVVMLHAKGFTDPEIAKRTGIVRRLVCEYRTSLWLKSNAWNERHRRNLAKSLKRQLKNAGVNSLAQLRQKVFMDFSEQQGWPGVSRMSAIIANLLWKKGPMTRRHIASHLGLEREDQRKLLANNRVPGGSYIAELVRAGYVVRLKRAFLVKNQGKGRTQDLYMIALEAQPCHETSAN